MSVDWRSRRLWHSVGYVGSAAWMIGVVAITGRDVSHPLFRYVFIVPLAGWIVGLAVARLLSRSRPRGQPE